MKIRTGNRGILMTLYFVIPCYNEEEVINETAKRLKTKVKDLISDNKIDNNSRVVFVDDGSTDKTFEIINHLHQDDVLFSCVKLSRNFGHQGALLAGLHQVKDYADAVISMDADLQDDIDVCDEMIKKYNEGCDVVYGVRNDRKSDSFFKRMTAQSFYSLMRKMGGQGSYTIMQTTGFYRRGQYMN